MLRREWYCKTVFSAPKSTLDPPPARMLNAINLACAADIAQSKVALLDHFDSVDDPPWKGQDGVHLISAFSADGQLKTLASEDPCTSGGSSSALARLLPIDVESFAISIYAFKNSAPP